MTGDEFSPLLSAEGEKVLLGAVERLLKSSLYQARLRRTLVNGWDHKVLADFLVLDDVVLALMHGVPETSAMWAEFRQVRIDAFLEARKSAERKLDVRVIDAMLWLHDHLLGYREEGETVERVFEKVYGRKSK